MEEFEHGRSAAGHIPVLWKVLAEQISLPQDAVMVDATIGHGGHSWLFGQFLSPKGVLIGLDFDDKCLIESKEKLKDLSCKVILIRSNFSEIADQVHQQGIEQVDFILADLGFCSSQVVDDEIGMSFQQDMPLDMRIDKRIRLNAADIVNKSDEKSLADLIYKYGQDRASRRIARFIVEHRQRGLITTTGQLASIVSRALSTGRKGKKYFRIHPATRTFQALRIAVNSELENLERLLLQSSDLLKKDGYIAVISFHSLEDRIVKNDFKIKEKEGIYKILTKKPIVPTEEEIAENRRARSSKLRIAQRL